MTDDLLVAQAGWLPNYSSHEIEAAQQRLTQHELNGTRVATRENWQGAARLPIQVSEKNLS